MSSSAPAPEQEQEKKYKGVRRRKWGRWVSEIRLPNSRERIWLGSYDSPEKAARAFDAAFVCLRGRSGLAALNFPDSPPQITGRFADPQEIQAAATSHANRARPPPAAQEFGNQSPQPMEMDTSSPATSTSQSEEVAMSFVNVEAAMAPETDVRIDWPVMNALLSPAGGDGAYDFLLMPPPPQPPPEDAEDGCVGKFCCDSPLWSF